MCSKHDRGDLRARAALLRAALASITIDVSLPRLPEQEACLRAVQEYITGLPALCGAGGGGDGGATTPAGGRRLVAALRAC